MNTASYAPNFGGGRGISPSGKFVFSPEAYLIEKRKVTTPVKGATLIDQALKRQQTSHGRQRPWAG
ncbi:hypothetical protein KCP77_04540 [Salmonella enterica subsp. enterica]|nr:hypothetical protein KCP77_04540 [Salmonella enterica subsp. enterica]